jgi:hypothetical protein
MEQARIRLGDGIGRRDGQAGWDGRDAGPGRLTIKSMIGAGEAGR